MSSPDPAPRSSDCLGTFLSGVILLTFLVLGFYFLVTNIRFLLMVGSCTVLGAAAGFALSRRAGRRYLP